MLAEIAKADEDVVFDHRRRIIFYQQDSFIGTMVARLTKKNYSARSAQLLNEIRQHQFMLKIKFLPKAIATLLHSRYRNIH